MGKSMTVLEWMTGERESRTGITRLNQELDADALNKTATGTALMQAQGQQQEEFIARNLAEAVSRLFGKKYRLMRREGDPFRVKVDGKYKLVDPSKWPEDINVNIRVGLGTGSKDKRIQARMMLAPIMAEGFANKQVEPKHLFHAVDGLVRDLGIGQGDDFWVDPDAPPGVDPQTGQPVPKPEEGPSPEMLAMQAEQQREDQKMQMEARKAEIGLQITQEQGAAKIDLMREEAAAKIELEREKAGAEADMNMRRMAFEQEMAIRAAEHNERMAERKAEADATISRSAGQGIWINDPPHPDHYCSMARLFPAGVHPHQHGWRRDCPRRSMGGSSHRGRRAGGHASRHAPRGV
ncbi:cell envelope integrity protein TolA [Sphingomonas sp. MMS24-JH45]